MKLAKVYESKEYEKDIYELWERSGAFYADPKSGKEPFVISMPPPNETGTLGVHHAIFLTLQDIMIRHARLKGKDALWLPGTDHAALAVNALIEKQLSEEGTDKHTVGRDEFLRRTKEFVGNSRDTMTGQMRAVGASADWSRMRYTLDEALNRCVNETFIKMHGDGLIYRGYRIVNWDPNLQTTVSDDELVYEEEKSKFYTFKYGPFEIGTARPETKFGDKYVVMHPNDDRYKQYKHGDTFETEWINGSITATVIKDKAIDMTFGTGVMTITPGHSHIDFEIAERHKLDKEQIINFHGKLLPIAGEFEGLYIKDARAKIVEKLDEKGLLIKTDENYVHNIALNDRGKGVIEPQIKLQWFVDVNKKVVDWKGQKLSLKEVMRAVVKDGDIKIMPKRFEKVYHHWIDILHDWCISRQIWWGHRIPVWYRKDTDGKEETYVGTAPPTDQSEGFHEWQQDPDTLDTWFSSALWTWSTLIDPKLAADGSLSLQDILEGSRDLKAYHPTDVMETGWDILFFWVTKMILATTYITGEVPFKTVYLHGMIRAEDGKKMSKSRPESMVDPMEVIQKYGADSLRLSLVMGVSPGNDQSWGSAKAEANRNFCNKLWNIARFVEAVTSELALSEAPRPDSSADHWILSRLSKSSAFIDKALQNFNFSGAYHEMYHLIWDDVADWYIEASKTEMNEALLNYVLEVVLKLAHPFAPFVTETIWQTLNADEETMLISSEWPKSSVFDQEKAAQFEEVQKIVKEVRQIKSVLLIQKGSALFSDSAVVADNEPLIKSLAKLESLAKTESGKGLKLTQTTENVWFEVDETQARKFLKSLENKQKQLENSIKNLKARLSNKSYVAKAPAKLIEETKSQLESAETELKTVSTQIKSQP